MPLNDSSTNNNDQAPKPGLEEIAKKIHSILSTEFIIPNPGIKCNQVQEILNNYAEKILNGEITENTIITLSKKTFSKKRSAVYEENLKEIIKIYATLTYINPNNMDTEELEATAQLTLDKIDAYNELYKGNSEYVRQRAISGGNVKSSNKKLAYSRIVDLLKSEAPARGWRMASDAADAIFEKVQEITKNENLSLPSDKEDLKAIIIDIAFEEFKH
jgi:hypothetical protein